MGRTLALTCTCAFLLAFARATPEGTAPDRDVSQREVDFMPEEVDLWLDDSALMQREVSDDIIMQREVSDDIIMQREVSDDIIMQREVSDDIIMQREVSHAALPPDIIKALQDKGVPRAADTHVPQVDVTLTLDDHFIPGGRPIFRPRSSGGPKTLFPPGQPSPGNLQAICLHGNQRPRYPPSSLPQSGFGHLYRQADAINRVESWYGVCCSRGNETQEEQEATLCCVKQAWKQALSQFCEDEFSIKTRHYHCCKKKSAGARLRCFHGDAPNPAYLPTNQEPESLTATVPGFTFDPSACQRSAAVQGKTTKTPPIADIDFPPGRPTAANIQSICRFRKRRPLYLTKCLPSPGYGWLARQAKAVNRLERGFKHCCKGGGGGPDEPISCADGKWREVLDRFCEEGGVRARRFPCCETPAGGEQRYDCFSARAPQPGYAPPTHLLSLPPAPLPRDPTLGQICETHKIIKKKFSVGFPVQRVVSLCCPLPAEERTACVQEKLSALSEHLCRGTKPSPPSAQWCCSPTTPDPLLCLTSKLTDAITMATKSPRLRKRKCPLP